jgi:hypothetical protein
MGFLPHSTDVIYYTDLHSMNQSHLVLAYNPCDVLQNSIHQHLLHIFVPMFISGAHLWFFVMSVWTWLTTQNEGTIIPCSSTF